MSVIGRMARISRPKLSGWGTHDGVLLPSGLVVHLTQDKGIQWVTFAEFAQGRPTQIKHEVPPTRHGEAMAQLSNLLATNQSYDLILNNCEVFARAAVLEKAESPQIALAGFVALIAVLWYSAAQA